MDHRDKADPAARQEPYGEPVAGPPDVLSSPPRRVRWYAVAGGIAVLVGIGLLRLGPDPTPQALPAGPTVTAAPGPVSSAVTTGQMPRTSAPLAPADTATGALPASGGTAGGTAAIEAARQVAQSHCSAISAWLMTLNGDTGEYRHVVVLMSPSGPAYPDVFLQVELTWAGDHYRWAASRSALEACP